MYILQSMRYCLRIARLSVVLGLLPAACRGLPVSFYCGTAINVACKVTYAQIPGSKTKFENNYSIPGIEVNVGYPSGRLKNPLSFSKAPTFPMGVKPDLQIDWRDFLPRIPAQWRQAMLDNVDTGKLYNPVLAWIFDATSRIHCNVGRAHIVPTFGAYDCSRYVQKDWRARTGARTVFLITYVTTVLHMSGMLRDVQAVDEALPERMENIVGFKSKLTGGGGIPGTVWLQLGTYGEYKQNLDGLCLDSYLAMYRQWKAWKVNPQVQNPLMWAGIPTMQQDEVADKQPHSTTAPATPASTPRTPRAGQGARRSGRKRKRLQFDDCSGAGEGATPPAGTPAQAQAEHSTPGPSGFRV